VGVGSPRRRRRSNRCRGDLAFSADKKNWDDLFHRGLPAVSGHDLDRIARAMAAERLAAQA
jgi:hypothetical protein